MMTGETVRNIAGGAPRTQNRFKKIMKEKEQNLEYETRQIKQTEPAEKTLRIRVFGIVQGVGFRPTVSRHAAKHGIRGTVCNVGPYVEILAQGTEEHLEAFCREIEEHPPRRAVILKLHRKELPEPTKQYASFSIIVSEKKKGNIFVSPDIAICPKCKEELYDKSNRRYLHPFINCTSCGPRLTILDAMPYDRERTSMKVFPMCETCAWEYTHPETRRYDAQPVCCHDCGPEVYLLKKDGSPPETKGPEAIREVRRVIKEGGIAAIKGIGGFHLCCDAKNEAAVSLLRTRKKRSVKPFAVMARDLEAVERECFFDERQAEILDGHQKPILLLKRRPGGTLCPSVAPGNPDIGVMLPYAPIQLLLFDYEDDRSVSDVLVMTSANTSGAPICRDDADALRELTGLCDIILSHNREIRLRADDTVMDFFRGEPYMIRRSRGYAPLPVLLSGQWTGEVIALGGELKNTFCVGKDTLFYPSPYIGDMEDARTVRALEESVERFLGLLEARPQMAACDLHPDYNTTAVAEAMGLPLLKVQHHYAHILSCMAENDQASPVIGVSFDGTGYGTDGTVWGGEIMTADYEGFKRLASIDPFVHVGGDAAVREGWRSAVTLLAESYSEEEVRRMAVDMGLCSEPEAAAILTMRRRRLNSVTSTSCGRVFDAVSAILGICRMSTFEGEASMALEFAAEAWEEEQCTALSRSEFASERNCRRSNLEDLLSEGKTKDEKKEAFMFPVKPGGTDDLIYLPTSALVRFVAEQKQAGEDTGKISYLFHKYLADMVVETCRHLKEKTGISTAALSGGVYQNRLFLRFCVEGLEREGFRVLTHHLIPPNDGGICLGQAAAAMAHLQKNKP